MRKSRKSKAIPTNLAVRPMTDAERVEMLERTTFGSDWEDWVQEIEGRIADVPDDAPLKQSTRRALAMIKEMGLARG